MCPTRSGLRYIRARAPPQPGRQAQRRLRSCACADIIAHWDDDDWYAPHRIRAQVEALARSGAATLRDRQRAVLRSAAPSAWEYVYPPGGAPWVYGATLCYRRDFWRAHPFADVTVGEDNVFVGAVRGAARCCVMDDNRFFVGRVHAATPAPSARGTRAGGHARSESVRALAGPAWPAVAPPAAPPRMARAGRTALVAAAAGIGDVLRTTPLIRALHQLDYAVDVLLAPDCAETADLLRGAPEIRRLMVAGNVANLQAAPPIPELEGCDYDVAAFTAWGAPLARRVKAARQLTFARADWLAEGDSTSVARIARALGWQGALPEPFAFCAARDFALAPGTIALHPGCKPGWPWKRWHGFDDLARGSRMSSWSAPTPILTTQAPISARRSPGRHMSRTLLGSCRSAKPRR